MKASIKRPYTKRYHCAETSDVDGWPNKTKTKAKTTKTNKQTKQIKATKQNKSKNNNYNNKHTNTRCSNDGLWLPLLSRNIGILCLLVVRVLSVCLLVVCILCLPRLTWPWIDIDGWLILLFNLVNWYDANMWLIMFVLEKEWSSLGRWTVKVTEKDKDKISSHK